MNFKNNISRGSRDTLVGTIGNEEAELKAKETIKQQVSSFLKYTSTDIRSRSLKFN